MLLPARIYRAVVKADTATLGSQPPVVPEAASGGAAAEMHAWALWCILTAHVKPSMQLDPHLF